MALKCKYFLECCPEMDRTEGEQSNCHFTINEGDAGDAAPSRYFFKSLVTKN
jgi:hypothetical protein